METASENPNEWYIQEMSDGSLGIRNKSGFICKMIRPTHYDYQDDRFNAELSKYHNDASLIAHSPELYRALVISTEVLNDMSRDIRRLNEPDSEFYKKVDNAIKIANEALLESGVPK